MSYDELSIVVDDDDNILCHKPRNVLLLTDRFRVSGVWAEDGEGNVLLAKRHPSKKTHPNLWGVAAAGGLTKGESYKENAIREVKEELGIVVEDLIHLITTKIDGEDGSKRFAGLFLLRSKLDIESLRLEKDQVSEVKWISKEWLLKDLEINPDKYVPGAYIWPYLMNLASSIS